MPSVREIQRERRVSQSLKSLTNADSPYAVDARDLVLLCDCSSGAITVNLPAANLADGRDVVAKKTDSTANAVTIDGNLAETIDGAATKTLTTQYQTARIISDGTSWHIRAEV